MDLNHCTTGSAERHLESIWPCWLNDTSIPTQKTEKFCACLSRYSHGLKDQLLYSLKVMKFSHET